jgi:predicted nucleic acid-binding Zn ribbon protein
MSFLFDKRTKKVLNIIWMVVAVLIILSMVLFFAPGLTMMLFGF